jgi:biopolymer transport protein ExbB
MNEWLLRAGWLAWPLVACALGVLTIFLERWWSLRQRNVLPAAWATACLAAIDGEKEVVGVGGQCGAKLLQAAEGDPSTRRERLEDAGRQLARQLERGLDWLSTLAAVSPLLGLTGTILGMIQVFQRITVAGAGDAQVLAGGIWMALITTVLGLVIAIPALVLRQILVSRLEARVGELEAFAVALGQRMSR